MAARAPNKKKRIKNRPVSSSSEGEEETVREKADNGSQNNLQYALDEKDKDKLVSDLCFYILTTERKRGVHRKADFFKAIGLTGQGKKLQDEILEGCQSRLVRVFGLSLEDQGTYFTLSNRIPQAEEKVHLHLNEDDKARLGLLHTVLALIFMNNGSVREEVLEAFLCKLGLVAKPTGSPRKKYESGRANAQGGVGKDAQLVFGDVRQLLKNVWTDKQHYLLVNKIETDDPEKPAVEYLWGARAEAEIKKSLMLKFMAKLYDCKPSCFKEQYDCVVQEEGEEVFDQDKLNS